MDYLKKIGFIKGLAAGLPLERDTAEQKILHAIIDALDDIGDALKDCEDTVSQLETGADSMADDLESLEDDLESIEEGLSEFTRFFADAVQTGGQEPIKLFPNEEADIFDFEDSDEDEDDLYDLDGEEEEYSYSVDCPVCAHEFILTENDLTKGQVTCPSCTKQLEFDISVALDNDDE